MTVHEEHATILLSCVPGTLCNGRAFAPLVAELRSRGLKVRQFNVDTGKAPTASGTAELALAAMAIRPDERLVIAGFSLGGGIAVQMALRSSNPVTGVILLDVNGEDDVPGNAIDRRAAVQRARDHGMPQFITHEIWPTHVAKSRLDDAVLRDLVVLMAEESGPDAFANQAEIAISRPRALDFMPALTVPTLVLCGIEDRITPVKFSEAIAAAAPNARLEIILEAGHFAILECAAGIADIAAPWIDSLVAAAPPGARMRSSIGPTNESRSSDESNAPTKT